jgi:phage terminase Nu1 subunit (DNA packaging protein)
MDDEITSGATQKLIGVNRVALNDLAKRGIVKRGERKDTYAVEASVTAYCQHLRSMAAGRGGEAGADVRARRKRTSRRRRSRRYAVRFCRRRRSRRYGGASYVSRVRFPLPALTSPKCAE